MNQLEGYKILNTVRPPYYNTKYPFTEFNDNKIKKLTKTISVIVDNKKASESDSSDYTKSKTKRGGGESASIMIYG